MNRDKHINIEELELAQAGHANGISTQLSKAITLGRHSLSQEEKQDIILEAASQIIPLARTAQEQIQFLQDWAAAGKARLASRDSRFGRIQSSLS
jgi:hypothetical protein